MTNCTVLVENDFKQIYWLSHLILTDFFAPLKKQEIS